jgi:hypothetical protein
MTSQNALETVSCGQKADGSQIKTGQFVTAGGKRLNSSPGVENS